jgi:hypothetical protein
MEIPLTLKRETLEWMFKQFSQNPLATIVFGNDGTDHSIVINCDDRIPAQWAMPPKGRLSEKNTDLEFTLDDGVFPDDITNSIRNTYAEALTCFENNCLSATLGLCGKIIETSLWSAFEKATGKTPESENLGLNAILNRLNKEGYQLKKEAISQQMELIGLYRNKAIHGGVVTPAYDQAKGILFLTRNVLVSLQEKSMKSDDSEMDK